MLCVHCFACAFYKVKKESALSPDDVETFYLSRDVDPTVSECVQINFSASIGLSWPILGRVTPSVVLLGYMLITLCCSAGSSTRVREYL